MPPRLLSSVRVWNRHIDDRVAFILRLVPGAAAGIISVAGVRIWRTAGRRQRVVCGAVCCGGEAGNRADRDSCTDRIIAPTIPAAVAPIAVAPITVAIADIDVAGIDVVSATWPLTRPSGTSNATDAADTADTANATRASGTAYTADATWPSRASYAADATWPSRASYAADATWPPGTSCAADATRASGTAKAS